ncbi:MAG: immunoglobulin domain-containing protein [Phycisphaerae bacterium]|nr:immunoglobulin domain-containing protein [Phycisphaerae bacterium]
MKKSVCTLFFLLLVYAAQGVLLDDFESYTPGALVNAGGTPWTMLPSWSGAAYFQAEADNTYVAYWGANNGTRGIYRSLGDNRIPASDTATTVFMRVLAETANTDASFGLTDLAVPTLGGDGYPVFGDFEVQAALISGTLRARNAGTIVNLATISVGTWYNIWLVVNNSTDTYSLYMTTGQTSAMGTTPLASNFGFRNGAAANDLVTILAIGATKANPERVRIDDIHIMPGVNLTNPTAGPYDPVVNQITPTAIVLQWKAAPDPAGVYAVNPAIVDQYVFMSTGNPADPNLYYIGATGADPGTDNPLSQYPASGTITVAYDKTYYWAVVEAIEGYQQSFSPGASFKSVDPNNIIGGIWTYVSTKSQPIITVQPADVRVFTTDSAASFTVEFTSPVNPVTAAWYKNDVPLTAGGDISIVTDPHASSTLTIATPELADEGKYYCILSVQEGTADDLQTATRMLVIKKELARFEFEENLADSSGNNAPAGLAKSVAHLAEPNDAAAVIIEPVYVDGIDGKAVYLSSRQYIDFGIDGYPKAGPLNTLGDIRGASYEKVGFGRGMDQGSILCWVKPQSNAVIYSNANAGDATHFALTTNGTTTARGIVRGNNYDDTAQNLGEASGSLQMTGFNLQDGKWHMFAATWLDSTIRVYLDGEQVATNTQGYTEKYLPWQRGNLLGASRTAANRAILNAADFLTGAVDKLRVYNYVIWPDEIAVEYQTLSGRTPCANHSFDGYLYNLDNTELSYCRIDLADFAVMASNWLAAGLYAGL